MLYIVECSYADPESEASWNTFYSQHKLPALVSVGGFRASQRFRALSSRSPLYLAIHTITDAAVIASEEYRLKGGGNFSRWQAHICDWRRNLYRYDDVFPQVSQDEVLYSARRRWTSLTQNWGIRRPYCTLPGWITIRRSAWPTFCRVGRPGCLRDRKNTASTRPWALSCSAPLIINLMHAKRP